MIKKIAITALTGATMCAVSPAFAAPAPTLTTTGKLDVQLEVTPGCAFSSGSGGTTETADVADAVLSFGKVTSESTGSKDGQAVSSGSGSSVTVTCSSTYTGANSPQLTLGAGLNAGAGTQRKMVGPAGLLVAYNLYQDAGRNIAYDSTTPVQLNIPTAGVATPINIYGRVPNVAGLNDGTYTDTVTMTLTY